MIRWCKNCTRWPLPVQASVSASQCGETTTARQKENVFKADSNRSSDSTHDFSLPDSPASGDSFNKSYCLSLYCSVRRLMPSTFAASSRLLVT